MKYGIEFKPKAIKDLRSLPKQIQIKILEKHNRIIHSSLNTIETAGGGSARCMMAEVFLEKK